jgi:hypothetical protein
MMKQFAIMQSVKQHATYFENILVAYKFYRSDLEAIKHNKNESINEKARLSHANAHVEMNDS